MSNVRIVGVTMPRIEGLKTAEELVAYAARVSNPDNQMNTETAPRLLKYLVNNHHWSPFEMVHVVMEIETTRDIARQILRHRSFSFQEFSQRYAFVGSLGFTSSEARMQDAKNRQASNETDDLAVKMWWDDAQKALLDHAKYIYAEGLSIGIAKEQMRKVLPEGLTNSRLYMSGTLRSWIHYCMERTQAGTQKEHREIGNQALELIKLEFPALEEILKV